MKKRLIQLNLLHLLIFEMYSNLSEPGFISEIIIKEIGTSSVLLTWPPPISDLWNINGYRVSIGITISIFWAAHSIEL